MQKISAIFLILGLIFAGIAGYVAYVTIPNLMELNDINNQLAKVENQNYNFDKNR